MSNEIIRNEVAVSLFGLEAKAHNVVMDTTTGRIRNQKIKVSKQVSKYERLIVTLRFDDECGNGHESFAITAGLYDNRVKPKDNPVTSGCLHDEIAQHFPELAHIIKWHLTSTEGPMHYIANTTYHAGNRDSSGLKYNEKRQLKNGRTGEPCWDLVVRDSDGEVVSVHGRLPTLNDSAEKPEGTYTVQWEPHYLIGEGKARDFGAARSCAIWPEATEEQLSLPKEELTKLLEARLPTLMAEFHKDMASIGFVFAGAGHG